jgi:hypothetical protein
VHQVAVNTRYVWLVDMTKVLRHKDLNVIFRQSAPTTVMSTGVAQEPSDHDYLQHHLGDDEDWGIARQVTAAPLTPPQPIDMANQEMTYDKPAPGSSHGAEIHTGQGDTQWLVKKAPPQAPHMVDMDVAANRIAAHSGLEAPATFKMNTPEGGTASAQLMYPGAKDAFPGTGPLDPEKLSDDDMATIQKHHALDWMLSNHDDHNRNFIRTQDGKLVGIDKGQSMKFFNNDRLAWDFFPNAHEPVHNTMYRNMAKGGRQLHDPRQGEVGKYIQGLQDIPDEEYQEMLLPYAQGAADQGELAKDWKAAGYQPHHGGVNVMGDPRIKPNDVAMYLEAATARKNSLMHDFGKLYDKAQAHRNTGTGIV